MHKILSQSPLSEAGMKETLLGSQPTIGVKCNRIAKQLTLVWSSLRKSLVSIPCPLLSLSMIPQCPRSRSTDASQVGKLTVGKTGIETTIFGLESRDLDHVTNAGHLLAAWTGLSDIGLCLCDRRIISFWTPLLLTTFCSKSVRCTIMDTVLPFSLVAENSCGAFMSKSGSFECKRCAPMVGRPIRCYYILQSKGSGRMYLKLNLTEVSDYRPCLYYQISIIHGAN